MGGPLGMDRPQMPMIRRMSRNLLFPSRRANTRFLDFARNDRWLPLYSANLNNLRTTLSLAGEDNKFHGVERQRIR